MSKQRNSEGFSSIIGFIFVAIGFAVGVGSLWRFPYVVGANGGAVFILAYIVVILLIGIPLLTAEISMGYASQRTAVQAYKELDPNGKWYLGAYLHIVAAVLIVAYTVPIYAWILNYIFRTATGFFVGMDADAVTTYFGEFTGNKMLVLALAGLNYLLCVLVIRGGLQKGVERFSKILLPALAVIMIIIIVSGLRLPGAAEGVRFLLMPNFGKFTFQSLLDCLGQAFFAVGIAMLASMVFGSYIKSKSENVFKSASVICSAIILAGVAAGFMIFPMVFANGLEPAAGPGLTFITLPNVFNSIPLGTLIGTLFYIGFYIAAFTSAVGVFESVVGVLMEEFQVKRGRALLYTMLMTVVVAVPSVLSDPFFNFIDMLENNYILIAGGLIITIFVGWIWGIEKCIEAANIKRPFIKIWMTISVKYIAPAAIVVIFAAPFFTKG